MNFRTITSRIVAIRPNTLAAHLFSVIGLCLCFVPPAAAQYPGGGNGFWKIELNYIGNITSTYAATGMVNYNNAQVKLYSPADPNVLAQCPLNGTIPLSSINPSNGASYTGSNSGSVGVIIGSQGLAFPGPGPGSITHSVSMSGGLINFKLTWLPKNNDSILDPPPQRIQLYYKRWVRAKGVSGLVNGTSTSVTKGLQTSSSTNFINSAADTIVQTLDLSVSGGQATAPIPIYALLDLSAQSNTPPELQSFNVFAECGIDISLTGFAIPRGPDSPLSGNHHEKPRDPSYTRWLPLNFSPQMNSQPFRTQAGALPAPWGNAACYYSIRFNPEPNPPNYDLFGSGLPYYKTGNGNQNIPGLFIPAYTITDASGARLVFNTSLQGYTDVSSLLSYNAMTGSYMLSNAGPPGAMKQKGHYTYTFSGTNLTSIADELGNQQTLAWSPSDPFLTVSDSSSGRSLVFHSPSPTSYLSYMDAKGPLGNINTHTVLTYDTGGHLTGNKVYDSTGIVLLHQDAFTYGGANGDAIITAVKDSLLSSFSYVTDNTLLDPFGLGTDRIAAETYGSSSDMSSAYGYGSVAGTYSYTWGPTQMGYNSWGVDAHTNTFTDANGNVFSSLFSLTNVVSGDINGFTNTWPSYSGAAAGSNRTIISYTPSMVKPTSVSIYDPLYYAGLTTNPWSANFDTNGNISSATDPLLNRWLFGYSAAGTELTSSSDPTGLTWSFSYGENGNPASRLTGVNDPASVRQLSAAYNTFGQLISETIPAAASASGTNEVTSFSYLAGAGDLSAIIDPLGNKSTIGAYTALGDPLSFSAYPDTGDPATSQAPLTASTTLNAAQMPTQTVAPNGVVATSTYTNGLLTQMQTNAPASAGGALLNQLNLSTDSRGRVYQVSDQGGLIASYKFDKNSNLKSTTDSRNNTTVYNYGANNELIQEIGAGNLNYSYDQGGRLSQSSLYSNKVTQYVYNPDNTLAQLNTTIDGGTHKNVVYSYDAAGRKLSASDWTGSRTYSYEPVRKRLQSVTTVISALPAGHNTFTNAYTYCGDGKVASVTTPVGVTTYSYNAGGQISGMNSPDGSVTSWQFDHIGRTTQRQTQNLAGNTFTVQYHYGGSHYPGDSSTAPYYLDRITNLVNSQTLWDYQIQHNFSGLITDIEGTGQNGRSLSAQYQYDFRGHLLNEQKTYTVDAQHVYTKSSSFSYDSAGNRSPTDVNWTYGAFNKLTSAPASSSLPGATGLAYDGAGNLSSMNGMQLAYDAFGSLESITNTPAGNQSFERDGTGQVLHQTIGGVSSYILYEGGAPIAELNNSGNVTVSYNQSPDGLLSDSQNGVVHDYFYNPHGDTAALVNDTTGVADWQHETNYTGQSVDGFIIGTPNYNFGGQSGAYNVPQTPIFMNRSGFGGYNANTGTGFTPGGYYNSDEPDEYIPLRQRDLYRPVLDGFHTGAEIGKDLLELGGYLTPYLGTAMIAGDVITGKTNSGHKLTPTERILLLASLIPIDRIASKTISIAKKIAPLIRGAEHATPILEKAAIAAKEARGGTYKLVDRETGEVVRTGRTNDFMRRRGEHARDPELGNYKFEIDRRTDSYAAQRGREQIIHEQYRPRYNYKNPIDPNNRNYDKYMQAGKDL